MDIMNFVTQSQVLVTIAIVIMLMWRMSYGYKYGLVAELLEIAALAVGFVVLIVTADAFNQIFKQGNFQIVNIVIRVGIVVAIYHIIQGLSRGSRGVGKIPLVGSANKLLGAAFGIIETFIWVRTLNYIIGYDFEGAVRYTIAGIASMVKV